MPHLHIDHSFSHLDVLDLVSRHTQYDRSMGHLFLLGLVLLFTITLAQAGVGAPLYDEDPQSLATLGTVTGKPLPALAVSFFFGKFIQVVNPAFHDLQIAALASDDGIPILGDQPALGLRVQGLERTKGSAAELPH